jgi:hypothetical protein
MARGSEEIEIPISEVDWLPYRPPIGDVERRPNHILPMAEIEVIGRVKDTIPFTRAEDWQIGHGNPVEAVEAASVVVMEVRGTRDNRETGQALGNGADIALTGTRIEKQSNGLAFDQIVPVDLMVFRFADRVDTGSNRLDGEPIVMPADARCKHQAAFMP